MGVPYLALYHDLLEDLSVYLPRGITDEESARAYDDWYPEMTPSTFSAIHIAKSFYKKFVDRTSRDVDKNALETFLQSNVQCKDWSLRMETLEDELLIGNFRQEIYRFFTHKGHSIIGSFPDILAGARVGPGASLLANGTDFYTKLFSSRLSCTSEGLYSAYENYFNLYSDWRDAEKHRSANFGEAEVVVGNRLNFVPKNDKTSRVICTEPTLNMFFQLGLGHLLEERLKLTHSVNLATQPDINRDLARIGSLTESLSTIDLKSASDTISMAMLEEFLPSDVLAWLRLFRSPYVELPDGSSQELYMVSSMGNGFTFPLQTILFSCVVSAAYYTAGRRLIKSTRTEHARLRDLVKGREPYSATELGNFGVFGDDIIVEGELYAKVVRLLNLLGFTVNAEKSFNEGPFRESCGGDYFRGHPVRGVYIKTLRSQASRFVAINRLNEWTAVTGIMLPRTVQRILKSTRDLPVPLWENDDAGLKVPMSMLRKRMRDPNLQSLMYRKLEAVPQHLRVKGEVFSTHRGTKRRIYNPSGFFLACLRGDVVNDSKGQNDLVGTRLGINRYRTKQAVAPNWDHLPTVGKQFPIGQARLASAIWKNLNG